MKVMHIGLVGPANEEMSYQGAILPRENRESGHDVTVVWGCHRWNKGVIEQVDPQDYVLDSIRYVRLPYDYLGAPLISEKVRKSRRLRALLEEISPDIVLFHDVQTYEICLLYTSPSPRDS